MEPQSPGQLGLFHDDPSLPAGLKYQPDLISPEEEAGLVARFEQLPFKRFEFHGHLGNRRVVSFGWKYEFSAERLRQADEMPDFLLGLRERAAAFAALSPGDLQHAMITEYGRGAGIGWHRDKGVFGEVIGISLLSPCLFRLRRRGGSSWKRASFTAEPRSAYLLTGPSRTEWEHSIPPVESLRYSITFRNLRS